MDDSNSALSTHLQIDEYIKKQFITHQLSFCNVHLQAVNSYPVYHPFQILLYSGPKYYSKHPAGHSQRARIAIEMPEGISFINPVQSACSPSRITFRLLSDK